LIPDSIGSGKIISEWTDDYIGEVSIIPDNSIYYDAAVTAGREPISDGTGGYYVVTKYDQLGEPFTIGNTVVPILAVIWICGVFFLTLYMTVSYWCLCRNIDMAVVYKRNIFQSENISTPFVLGIIRPRIYIPFKMGGQDLKYVIAHEQAHIRRKDHWWKPLGFLLLTIHWFNPLMWLSYILLCRDIELACDEKVIKELSNKQKADYAQALVRCSVNRYKMAACPIAFGETGVKERVKSILKYKKPTFWIMLLAVISCILIAVCFLTNPSHSNNDDRKEDGYYLLIGAEGVSDIKVSTPSVSGGCKNADGTPYKKGEKVWLEQLNGVTDLRGLLITAYDENGNILYAFSVPENVTNEEITDLVGRDSWLIAPTGVAEENVENSVNNKSEMLSDIAYHLELSTLGKEFQDMTKTRKNELLREYDTLLEGYELTARESVDGTASYIAGVYRGNPIDSPLSLMYSHERTEGNDRAYQMLYTEEEAALADEKGADAGVGYVIDDSRITVYKEAEIVLIEPEGIEFSLGSALYKYLKFGKEYIQDAVDREIFVNNPEEPYLSVYLVSEQYGEMTEYIPLNAGQATDIYKGEKTELPEGVGFGVALHMDGEMYHFGSKEIPKKALELAVERCNYRFETPKDINDKIVEARLDCGWLKEPLYAKEEDLARLQEILVNAKYEGMSGCGYYTKLAITLANGEQLILFKGTDGCDTIAFGSWSGYTIGKKENVEFWEMFGLDAETKVLILGEDAVVR